MTSIRDTRSRCPWRSTVRRTAETKEERDKLMSRCGRESIPIGFRAERRS
jgi:hypothetical protein